MVTPAESTKTSSMTPRCNLRHYLSSADIPDKTTRTAAYTTRQVTLWECRNPNSANR